jgi:hypothetical protein
MTGHAGRLAGSALALSTLLTLVAALPPGAQEERATFDPAASARASIAKATQLATKKNRRVLLVWGSDARAADVQLCVALRRGKTEEWPFYYEYVITPIDQSERNATLAEALGAPSGRDGPALTILDASGAPLVNRRASEFLGAGGWDTEELGAFLAQHVVEPLDAEVVMKEALAAAAKENKRLFVHLGAPW